MVALSTKKAALVYRVADPDFDFGSAPRVLYEFAVAMKDADCNDVVVDMATVCFLDSSGVGALVGMHNAVTAHRGSLRLVGVNQKITRVLDMLGLTNVLAVG